MLTTEAAKLDKELRKLGTPERAAASARYFKTGPGQYGEGDIFLGLSVPDMRRLGNSFKTLTTKDLTSLLTSPIHEHRFAALEILVAQFKAAKQDIAKEKQIIDFYLQHTKWINNWDLVDTSATIVGVYLMHIKDETMLLKKLAASSLLWEQRISIIATMPIIRAHMYKPTFIVADMLLNHKHDLIHKAVGWMLREVGNKDMAAEENFLLTRYKKMPRTMLRYAIEKFPEAKRKAYLLGTI